jgi:hypothetical protein
MWPGRIWLALSVAALAFSLRAADPEKTGNKLLISGTRAIQKLLPSDLPHGGSAYVGRGWIELEVRGTAPSEVKVWQRGIPELDLFLDNDSAAAETCPVSPRQIIQVPVQTKMRVGYRYCIPVARFDKAQGEIYIGADQAEPEKLPISLERAETFFESKTGSAIMPGVLLIAGALIGLLTYYLQQRIAYAVNDQASFWGKKMGMENDLVEFFRDKYRGYAEDPNLDDQGRARALRRFLSSAGFYAILPAAEVRKLNRYCDGVFWEGRRMEEIDLLLRHNFGEMMRKN